MSTTTQSYGPNEHFQKLTSVYGPAHFDQQQIINQNYSSTTDLEILFDTVLNDPRYNRLRAIWDPKWTNSVGAKQKVKNLFDPRHIPYAGTVIQWNRARRADKNREHLEKLQEANKSAPHEEILETMKTNLRVNEAGLTAAAGAKTFFMFFPLVYFVPGGDASLSHLAEKGASKSAVKGAKAAASGKENENASYDVNDSWGATKALLLYLGAPRTDDPVYHSWEDSRIQLKEFFGAGPMDDLNLMEPKGDTLKAIEEAETTKGGYDLNVINVPLLVLLWRFYECWREPYAEKLTSDSHKLKREERWRAEDERMVLEMVNPVDPHIQKLDTNSVKSVVRLLKSNTPMAYGNHTLFNFLEERSEEKREKRLKWMLNTFAKKMIDSETGWAYYADPTNTGIQAQLLAVVFFERAEQDHYEPSDLLKTFGGMLSLKMDYSNISSRLTWEDKVMKAQIGKKPTTGILHMFASLETMEGKDALVKLIQSQINYTSFSSYCQEYDAETERIQVLERSGFTHKSLDKDGLDMTTYSKDDKSPRLAILEHFPPARDASSYRVPTTHQQGNTGPTPVHS